MVDMYSYTTPLSYPRGTFSIRLNSQRERYQCSLDQDFSFRFLAFENLIKPAFRLAVYPGFPNQVS